MQAIPLGGRVRARLRALAHGAQQALATSLVAEREQWVLWLAAAIGGGVLVYFALPGEPPGALGVTLLALAATLAWTAWRVPLLLVLLLAVGAVATGFTAAEVRTALVAAPVLQEEIGPVAVSGRLQLVEVRPDDRRLTLGAVSIARLPPEQTPQRIRVTVRARGGEALVPGQRVSLRAVLVPPAGPAAPGAFDFAREAYFDRLGGVGYAVSAVTVLEAATAAPWSDGLVVVRHALSERIRAVLPGQVGAIAAALTTGERAGIDTPTWNALRDSGLAHILSISGLHFGLVAGILFFVVRAGLALVEPIALRFPIKKWAAVAALAGAFGYFLLAGANAPTERSFLMLSLAMVAILLDRRPFSMRMVTWAAVGVLLVAPDSLLGPSFQMSFAAVVALVAAYDAAREPVARWARGAGPVRKAALYVFGVALSSLVAGLATAPYALYHFDRFSTYSLAANLAAVPLTGFWIMPWAVASFALMPFGLERLALVPMGWGIEAMLAIGTTVANWPGAAVLLPAMPTVGIALLTVGGLWLCLWRTPWRVAGVPLLVAGVATIWLNPQPDLLISDDAGYIAVRAADGGLWVSSARSNFTTDTWLRRDGREAGGRWPAVGAETSDGRLRCDRVGCLYRLNGRTVALPADEGALIEDCRSADVVVARVAVPIRCAAPTVIDRIDLWREGALALWLGADEVRVRSVADTRGVRPWTPLRPSGR